MRVVVTGGGTAGHVTPILAVAAELKKLDPQTEITFVRQFGDKNTSEMIAGNTDFNHVHAIAAGKFRRYYGVPWTKQALDIPMQLKNIRDALFFVLGLIQSFVAMLIKRPDVVFVKGGYVGLPVGLAASLLGIPLVIHESDIHMGLTNKTLSSRASAAGVGMPAENYSLGDAEVHYVGVPVSDSFHKVNKKQQKELKEELGLKPEDKLIVITGGSLGAERINQIVSGVCVELASEAFVVHQAGSESLEETREVIYGALGSESDKYRIEAHIDDMAVVMGAADIVVSRVGTTTMAELAILAKPSVLIPNPKLVYGHQLKNAEAFESAGAGVVVDEAKAMDDPNLLLVAVNGILDHPDKAKELSTNINNLAKPDAAKDIAQLILSKA